MVLNLMRKKLLAAAVMGAVGAAVGICTAGAADAAYVLDEVVVIGNRDEERDVCRAILFTRNPRQVFWQGRIQWIFLFPDAFHGKVDGHLYGA